MTQIQTTITPTTTTTTTTSTTIINLNNATINDDLSNDFKIIKKNPTCFGCGGQIHDQYILRVSPDLEWHATCLKCVECGHYLDENCTCFVRNGKTYCKLDYFRLFTKKCSKCREGFNKNDFFMRANNKIFHIDCFRCSMCNKQFSPGDEFSLRDDDLYCKLDSELLEKQTCNLNNITNMQLPMSQITISKKCDDILINDYTNDNVSLSPPASSSHLQSSSTSSATTTSTNSSRTINYNSTNSNISQHHHALNMYKRNNNTNANPNPKRTLNIDINNNSNNNSNNNNTNTNTNSTSLSQIGSNTSVQSSTTTSTVTTTSTPASATTVLNNNNNNTNTNLINHHHHHHHRKDKTTRVRTVLNEKQLHTLRTCYGANPRPDALMKEQLVEMTGLSPRVIRVWFQNKRCKDKKKSIMMKQMQEQQKNRQSIGHGIPMIAASPVQNDISNLGPANHIELQTTSGIYQSGSNNSVSWKINDYSINTQNQTDMNNLMNLNRMNNINNIGISCIGNNGSNGVGNNSGMIASSGNITICNMPLSHQSSYDQMMSFGSDEEDCFDNMSDQGGGDDSVSSSIGGDDTRIQQL